VYNMDEKGFMLGTTGRSKRVFSKRLWQQKRTRQALQDGSREWISILASVCADGTMLSPGIIYEGKSGIQNTWLQDLIPGEHHASFAHSASGWSNNNLGLAWLEQVFNCETQHKARRRWRLLILDGHASHLTLDFINFCKSQKILLAVFPPHATHSLQPLDVVLFAPLSRAYSLELQHLLHQSQGLVSLKKGHFFLLF
jgi:hypothetical protein